MTRIQTTDYRQADVHSYENGGSKQSGPADQNRSPDSIRETARALAELHSKTLIELAKR